MSGWCLTKHICLFFMHNAVFPVPDCHSIVVALVALLSSSDGLNPVMWAHELQFFHIWQDLHQKRFGSAHCFQFLYLQGYLLIVTNSPMRGQNPFDLIASPPAGNLSRLSPTLAVSISLFGPFPRHVLPFQRFLPSFQRSFLPTFLPSSAHPSMHRCTHAHCADDGWAWNAVRLNAP